MVVFQNVINSCNAFNPLQQTLKHRKECILKNPPMNTYKTLQFFYLIFHFAKLEIDKMVVKMKYKQKTRLIFLKMQLHLKNTYVLEIYQVGSDKVCLFLDYLYKKVQVDRNEIVECDIF